MLYQIINTLTKAGLSDLKVPFHPYTKGQQFFYAVLLFKAYFTYILKQKIYKKNPTPNLNQNF